MVRSRTLVVAAVIATGLVVPGCSKPLVVGAVVAESGAVADYGREVRKGIELALEDANAAGGFHGKPIGIVFKDDQTRAEVGEQVTRELIEIDKVPAIIGAVSSPVTLRIAPLCEENRVVLISPTASAPSITAAGEYVYRVYPSDLLEGTSIADFARDLGLERVVVVAVDDAFGAGLRDVFTQKFSSKYRQVIETLMFPIDDRSKLVDVARKVAALAPEGVYVAAYATDVGEFLKELRATGSGAIVMGNSGFTEKVLQIAGTAAENLVYPQPSFDPDSEDAATRKFVTAFRAKYGAAPSRFAAHGYDAFQVLAKAIREGDSTHPDNIRIGLTAIDNFQGASGRLAFDSNGDIVQYPRIFVIRSGAPLAYEKFVEQGGKLTVPGAE